MVRVFDHLPKSVPSHDVVADFPEYPSSPQQEWMKRSLSHLSINGITAIFYACTKEWRMRERTIRDDMFFYIVKGSGTALVESRPVRLRPGICTHFRRGVLHAATHDPKNPIQVISLHFNATVLGTLTIPELFGFPDSFATQKDKVVEQMMFEACREYAYRPPGYERSLEALVTRMLFHFIRNYSRQLKMDDEEKKLSELQRLLPALELMRSDLKTNLPLNHYAQKAGLSEVQFRRVFYKAMKTTPVEYLRRMRMERACSLLQTTNLTIETISSEVGYAEPAFFAHTFKKLIGMPPGQYRQHHEL